MKVKELIELLNSDKSESETEVTIVRWGGPGMMNKLYFPICGANIVYGNGIKLIELELDHEPYLKVEYKKGK